MVTLIGSVESLVPASALWLGLTTYTSIGPSLNAILAVLNLITGLVGFAMPAGGGSPEAGQGL